MEVVDGEIVTERADRASPDHPPWSKQGASVERSVRDDGVVTPLLLGEVSARKKGSRLEPWAGRWSHGRGRFGARPYCAERNLDKMMATYESLVTQAVSAHIAKRGATSTSLGQDQGPSWCAQRTECSLERASSDAAASKQEISESQTSATVSLARSNSDLKRKRVETSSSEVETDHLDCGWSHPLRILVRKGLSVSDVGDLGRIVIPKKDAESQFQHIDTKQGALLEMDDYSGSKRWFFRFKWWCNNKSRMYVLENTREFIKYHNLKEHDIFVVYEDRSRKMVVRAHKGPDLDSTVGIHKIPTSEAPQANHPSPKRMAPASTAAVA